MFEVSQSREAAELNFLISELGSDVLLDYPTVSLETMQKALDLPEAHFVTVKENGRLVGGLFELSCELHTMFLPELRGRRAILAMREVLDWIRANVDCPTLRSYFYSHRPEVAWFAHKFGFSNAGEPFDDGSTFRGEKVFRTNLVRTF